jgi:quercetin dioxygenase-like cupin family protein
MKQTRRELAILLPAMLAVADAEAQTARNPMLTSKCYEFKDLPVKVNEKTHGESRQVFDGTLHDGEPVDMHITLLAPGQMPHPPHHHEWEEIIMLQTGLLEFTIKGNSTRVGPGSVVYIASNEEHGLKNVGDVPSQYFVLATARRSAG